MSDTNARDDDPNLNDALTRRRMLGVAAATAAGAWVAPAILSSPAHAQATPGGGGFQLQGDVSNCQGAIPAGATVRVWATATNGPPDPNDTVIDEDTGITGPIGSYTLDFPAAGFFDVFAEITFPGPFTSPPEFQGNISVSAGTTDVDVDPFFCP